MKLYQQLINLIPPHKTYIATHAGHDAIACMKRPADKNIMIDLDADVIGWWKARIATNDDAAGVIATSNDGRRQSSPPPAISSATIARGEGGRHRHHWRCYQVDATAWLGSYPFTGDEFAYVDPPYLIGSRSSGREFYNCEMTDSEHEALLRQLLRVDCNIMISHYHHEMYMDMLSKWHWRTFRAYDRAGNEKTEYVWMNYEEPASLHDYAYLGETFRERERIKRKRQRWAKNWQRMDRLERLAILAAIEGVNQC